VCPSCGQSQPAATAAQTALASHLRLLAVFWFVIAGLNTIATAIMLALGTAAGMAMHLGNAPPPVRLLGPALFWAIGIFCAALAALSFLTGWGLLKVRPWGRVLALVLGFILLPSFPFGTALGVYTLIVLLSGTAGQEYERMAQAAA
jgi:hypothetical protein